ncbi:hypothetical protein GCM10008983_00050 [Lentibacillus halophilus]|uniref:Uncharacterized protein n=1 Tax=Lentibacillus halophilus TaxID=295065 RepID=A0ABP3IUL5_9BACI
MKKQVKKQLQKFGDCPHSSDLLREAVGFKPETPIEEGLQKFAD